MNDGASSNKTWTILEILKWTEGFFDERGIESPRVDAEVLLADVLDLERIELYAQFDRPLETGERDAFRARVKRRAERQPCAYIVGRREFWSLDIEVDPRVLIPRPDTETLVRTALDYIDEDDTGRLVDIGTGSGAVALAIATERPGLQIAATDNDPDTLDVATQNIENHDLEETVSTFEADLLDGLPDEWLPLDFIVSNPPYVEESERDELQPEVRDHEPADALFAGPDGLDVIRRLVAESRDVLRPDGWLLFEIGHEQGDRVAELLEEAGYEDVDIVPDYADRDRVAVARTPDKEDVD